MSLVFISDIHGSPDGLTILQDKVFPLLSPKQIVILGDVLYHGPRNGVFPSYDTQAVVEILNQWKEKIIAVRGNCDADVDQMLLLFPLMSRYSTLLVNDRKFFLTHGHIWNPGNLPPMGACDIFASGHTHVPVLTQNDDGIVIFNPGSITLPKSNFPPTFGVLHDDGTLAIYRLDGEWPENPTLDDLKGKQLMLKALY